MADLFNDIDVDVNYFSEQYPDLGLEDRSKYYDISELSSDVTLDIHDLSVLSLNIWSLLPKLDEFTAILHVMKHKFDVICLTETWLNGNVLSLANITGYKSYHKVREGRRGGGVSIYINENISCKILDDYSISSDDIECLFIECQYRNVKFLIGCIYRPPSGDCGLYMNHMDNALQRLSTPLYAENFICGDFNFNMLESQNDLKCLEFMNMMSSYSYIPLITKPTRINDISGNHALLDNIFIRNSFSFVPGVIMFSISDHYPIFSICKKFFDTVNPSFSKQFRSITDNNLAMLYNCLSQHDFSNIYEIDDLNEAFVQLERVVFGYYNDVCPLVTRSATYKDRIKPWIDQDVKREIKLKNGYYKLFRRGIIERHAFNRIRNRVNRLIKERKRAYFSDRFEHVGGDVRRTWTLINDTIKPSLSGNRGNIAELVIGDSVIRNSTLISEKLNDHFSSVGRNIASSITVHSDHREFLSGDYPNSFFLPPVVNSDIVKYINELKTKRCGNDCLPVGVLKRISCSLAPVLCFLFNKSIRECTFPDEMKVARVVPLHKGGDPNCMSNYRPISVLNVFSKILEKHVYKHLYSFLEKYKILSSTQFGFRNGRGTAQAIVRHTSDIYEDLDGNDLVFSLYLDFKKAFDSVDHDILLDKLLYYGIRGDPHCWFKSYLTNRKQFVHVNNVKSKTCSLTHSVPQGSNLGPLLFLLYINDFPLCSNYFKFIMFADDCTLTCPIKRNNLDAAHQMINQNLESIFRWTISNRIKINAQKTKFILYSFRNHINLNESIIIGGEIIEQVTNVKFLGMFIDSNLRFNYHVHHISKKIARCLGILYKLRDFFPTHILKSLYYTLAYPYLSYGIEVWYSAAPNYVKNQIEILQKKIIRVIQCLDRNEHTLPHFVALKLFPLEYIFKYRVGFYMFKTLNFDQFDPDLKSRLCTSHDRHNLYTRNRNKFIIPTFNRVKADSHIHVICVKIYNSLPEYVTAKTSLSSFKYSYKCCLFSSICI